MSRAGMDNKDSGVNLEHEPVGGIYADAPPTRKATFKRFRLPDAVIAIAFNAFEKIVDALDGFLVTYLPIGIFRPCPVIPKLLHVTVLWRRLVARRGVAERCGTAFGTLSSFTSMRSWKW